MSFLSNLIDSDSKISIITKIELLSLITNNVIEEFVKDFMKL